MYLWKIDLKGAYQLLSFRPEDVGLFAMRLSDDLVYLHFVDIFGWSRTPAAFQVVTRAVQWELGLALEGRTLMYVDDIVGVCLQGRVCCPHGLYGPADRCLNPVFKEGSIATKLSRKNGSVGSKNQSVRFWCKSFLIKRRKKCA